MSVGTAYRHDLMAASVRSGVAIDLGTVADEVPDQEDVYRFRAEPDLARAGDLCSVASGEWLWSIARHKATGQIYGTTIETFRWAADCERLWERE
ncbi:MAG: hypothetical protein M3N56_09665 [Actinomycetota bacterium]|nr:hypothetical protein [Actinomycetota bacterium]